MKKISSLSESLRSMNLGDWIRIAILILIIVWSYAGGVVAWLDKWGHMWGKYVYSPDMKMENDENMDMWRKKPMKMDQGMSSMVHMDMSMSDMGKMLEGKTGDELNKAFLEGMIPHHQAAVDMAKYLAASNKPELVKLGGEIIAAQQKEIDQMKAWQIAWGYTSTRTTASGAMMMDDAMREHCKTMPNMVGCEKYR